MKTLIVLLMATSAINAFFIGERSREDFIDTLHRMFLNMQFAPQLPHSPPLGMSEMERIRNRFESLTLDEQDRLKNFLFGERFPKPMPAHHIERSHSEFDEEKFNERREKWEAMTQEERDEHIKNHKKEHLMIPHHKIRPHPEFNEEKLKEMREKFEAMTDEEREEFIQNHKRKPIHFSKLDQQTWESKKPEEQGEIKVRSPRSVGINPLPEIELKRPTRPVEDNRKPNTRPEPQNNGNNLVRSPRSFQPIRPLPEFEEAENKRPVRPVRPRQMTAPQNDIDVQYSDIQRIIDQLQPDEKDRFFRELFPNGLPIRPIGVVPAGKKIQPISDEENKFAEYVSVFASNSIDNGRTRIVDPWGRDRISDNKEPQMRPVPLPNFDQSNKNSEWNNRYQPRPRPAQFQPIIPLGVQPIVPLPDFIRPVRPVFN